MSAAHKTSAPVRIARATASAVLIVVTCILVPVALMTVWVHDIALDTDRYVKTVAPLATEPAIQDAAVDRISEAVDVRIDGDRAAAELADWLRSQGLPPQAAHDPGLRAGPARHPDGPGFARGRRPGRGLAAHP
jgi:hypothetical protein